MQAKERKHLRSKDYAFIQNKKTRMPKNLEEIFEGNFETE